MHNSKKNGLLVWKMIQGIWEIFARTLASVKIGTLMESFGPKWRMYELKTYRGVICNDTEEWWKIRRGIELLFQNWLVVSKVYNVWVKSTQKKYRGVTFPDTGGWCKIWRKTDLWFEKWHEVNNEERCKIWKGIYLSVQNWHEEFNEFWPKHLKMSKIYTLMECFWPKYVMFELKKSTEEFFFLTLKIDAKFEGKLTCTFKNDRNLTNFHQSTWKSQNWDFDEILLSKVENVWA